MWPFKSKARRDREALEQAGRAMIEGFAEGIRQAEVRQAAGLPPEPLSDEALAWAAGVVHRSFPFLYCDDEENSRPTPQ